MRLVLIAGLSPSVDKMAERTDVSQTVVEKDGNRVSPQDLRDALSSVSIESNQILNQELIDMLKDMGFSENAAKRSLFYTSGRGIEDAIEWLDVNADEPELNSPFVPTLERLCTPLQTQGTDTGYEADDEPDFKMLFVVNGELKMGVGKTAAQVAHATLGLYSHLQNGNVQNISNVATWEISGARKIVVDGKGVSELEAIRNIALSRNIPIFCVKDAGKTQIPAGSFTVLALFGSDEELDGITGHLKLL